MYAAYTMAILVVWPEMDGSLNFKRSEDICESLFIFFFQDRYRNACRETLKRPLHSAE